MKPTFLKIKRKKETVSHQRLTGTSILKGGPTVFLGNLPHASFFCLFVVFCPSPLYREEFSVISGMGGYGFDATDLGTRLGKRAGDPVGLPSISQFSLHLSLIPKIKASDLVSPETLTTSLLQGGTRAGSGPHPRGGEGGQWSTCSCLPAPTHLLGFLEPPVLKLSTGSRLLSWVPRHQLPTPAHKVSFHTPSSFLLHYQPVTATVGGSGGKACASSIMFSLKPPS